MKTLIALFITVNMFGSVSPDYISTFYYDPSVTISFSNWKEGNLNVKIATENGEIIFNDKLNTRKSDGIKYNLRNLEAGKYNIILENTDKKVVETVILFDGKIVEKEATVYFKPVIQLMNDKAKVNFLSSEGKATVSILRAGEQVYFEKFKNANPLNKMFDLSRLSHGSYEIIVTDGITSRTVRFER